MSCVGKILQISCFSILKQHGVAVPREAARVAGSQRVWDRSTAGIQAVLLLNKKPGRMAFPSQVCVPSSELKVPKYVKPFYFFYMC